MPHQCRRQAAAVLAAAVAAALAACSHGSPAAPAAAQAAPSSAAAASASASCGLRTTFDYIVRDYEPGSVDATEIGNVDLANCTDALSDFAATAGQAQGECTTIAKAADNPGYDTGAASPPPLKDVIQSAGPGC